ncbi:MULTISPECIES: aspartate aminotransferase family protein [Burkholderia]|uniref:aspartate aminotransferase family protein n=1 Tax=Burkholderia TaxID=32008 RepID=UPI000F598DCC|nr:MULTISPECIES: aspartate aminotransferase family protein [Burkholderia]MBN3737136.1 aspartate aminotransferase family protein [Burkholderia sp. Tr-20355]RQS67777.1 aspartate aminotransferase family protein [Burkholderia seminalis]
MHMLKQNDIDHVLHPYTNLSRHRDVGPMVIERGEGVYVYDTEGNRYIEALSGLFCASLGFSEQRLADAADRQMRKLPFYHAFGHKSSEPSILLAEKLIAMAPVPMSKVFFANSGSEANDTAVKLIWYYNNALGRPLKKKIIARTRAYHGVTIASASLTGLPNNHRDFDLPIDRILHTDCPHYYRHALPGESEEQFATRCADSLEQLILREGPETIAAFFAEPVMASGGVIVPPATYMEKIQRVLKRYDILLVADEVICGFGRTGNMFGSETFGMQPDMIVVAKQLSAGYLPISALMVNEGIYRALVAESEKIGTFGHGFTYSGHPVCAAVALETLRIYDEDGVLDHVRDVIPHFQQRVADLAAHPLVGEARGSGLLAAVELVADKATKAPFPPAEGVAIHAGERALTYGMITRALGDTFNFCPPLIITHDEIDQLFDASKQALDDTLAWRRSLAAR